jgi:hypothetical protein
MTAVKAGYEHFFEEFNRLQKPGSDSESREDLRATVEEVLTKEILEPAHEYLDFNEEMLAQSSRSGQITARRMVLALLLLGFSGPVAGLLAGFAIARGVSRSLVQLSVPVRDVAGRLNEVVGPITVSAGRDIDELEAALRRMANQIGTVVSGVGLFQPPSQAQDAKSPGNGKMQMTVLARLEGTWVAKGEGFSSTLQYEWALPNVLLRAK